MTAQPRDLTRDEQETFAVSIVQKLMGDRPAAKVAVEVTRGGTLKVVAEAGDGPAKRGEFKFR